MYARLGIMVILVKTMTVLKMFQDVGYLELARAKNAAAKPAIKDHSAISMIVSCIKMLPAIELGLACIMGLVYVLAPMLPLRETAIIIALSLSTDIFATYKERFATRAGQALNAKWNKAVKMPLTAHNLMYLVLILISALVVCKTNQEMGMSV